MSHPTIISTWPFGMAANEAAWPILASNGIAMDAVVAGATQCENDPNEHSVGLGGWPDSSGEVTLDASVMDHAGRCGAVACMKRIKNAAQVARMVMDGTPYVLLAGDAATRFAVMNGMAEENLLTPEAAARYQEWRLESVAACQTVGHDTLGILAIDSASHLAGACTTSGLAFKLPGRVGDSPIIGAGLYVDGKVGAATATGQGEEMIKACGSFAIVENLRRGMEPGAAIADVLERLRERRDGNVDTDVSFLALRADGAFAGMTLRKSTNFRFAVVRSDFKQLMDAQALSD